MPGLLEKLMAKEPPFFDKDVWWKRRKIYVPVSQAQFGGVGGLTLTQLGSTPVYGIKITAVGTAYQFIFPIPHNINNLGQPVGFRINWANGTLNNTITSVNWILLAGAIQENGLFLDASIGDLDTPIALAQALNETPESNDWTSRGVKNLGWSDNDSFIQASVELDAVGGVIDATNFLWLLGVEMDYVPKFAVDSASEVDSL